ncbi:hypothetical protein [Paenibacillus vandeheii]
MDRCKYEPAKDRDTQTQKKPKDNVGTELVHQFHLRRLSAAWGRLKYM